VDLERFWADNDLALCDPFSPAIPQFPMGIALGYEAVFSELGHPFNLRRLEEDYEFARSVAAAYNDKAQRLVGRRLLDETFFDPSRRFSKVKPFEEIFGCWNVWERESWWALQAADTPQQLQKLLDRVENLDLEAEIFPPNWEPECHRIFEQHGLHPFLRMDLRGPVTLGTSIFGVENLIYLILGLPIPQAIFAEFAPGPNDRRYQHSDSAMGHLLPALARTNLNAVNFGPKVRFAQIRQHLPRAVVHGTLAPFTFMRNDEDAIIAEVCRDMQQARPTRGLVIDTAGSINDGSLLSSMRTVMWTIHTYGRLP
jgi:uroporphyrinogen decarboxylase